MKPTLVGDNNKNTEFHNSGIFLLMRNLFLKL